MPKTSSPRIRNGDPWTGAFSAAIDRQLKANELQIGDLLCLKNRDVEVQGLAPDPADITTANYVALRKQIPHGNRHWRIVRKLDLALDELAGIMRTYIAKFRDEETVVRERDIKARLKKIAKNPRQFSIDRSLVSYRARLAIGEHYNGSLAALDRGKPNFSELQIAATKALAARPQRDPGKPAGRDDESGMWLPCSATPPLIPW